MQQCINEEETLFRSKIKESNKKIETKHSKQKHSKKVIY